MPSIETLLILTLFSSQCIQCDAKCNPPRLTHQPNQISSHSFSAYSIIFSSISLPSSYHSYFHSLHSLNGPNDTPSLLCQ